jgi:hypothetical protein
VSTPGVVTMQLSGQHQPQGGGLVLCCFLFDRRRLPKKK